MNSFLEDIGTLEDINEACKYLENNIEKLEANHEVLDFWVAFRNKAGDAGQKQLAQWELECFKFQIVGAKVFSWSYSTGEHPGEVYEFPVLDAHQNAAFSYIKERAENTPSLVLKARYNHLLWKAIKGIKNEVYAARAVDAYFEVLNSLLDSLGTCKLEGDKGISKCCAALACVVAETKYKIPETVQLFRHLLINASELKFYSKVKLIEIMLKHTTVFKATAFEDMLRIFETDPGIPDAQKTDDFSMAHYYLPVAVSVASKLKSGGGVWYTKIGECYSRMGDAETDPGRLWIRLQHYALATRFFRQAGNTVQRMEAEEKYAAAKDNVTLPESIFNYSEEHIAALNKIEEEIKEKTQKLLEKPAASIYEFLAKAKFLPPAETIKITEADKRNSWMNAITTVKFDINKNIESISSDEEEHEAGMDRYKYYIRHYTTAYLYHTLVPGIRSGKLSFKNLVDFLHRYTWVGFPLTKKDLGGEVLTYNWIGMLAPSLQEYFLQMESSLLSREYKPNFMLAIDGLTIKFEGLFREFCTRIKVPSSTNNKGSMQELYIHQLLRHPAVTDCFAEDARLFFEFLFTKENGLNLRNNVAHCYFDFHDYNYNYFHLLLAALLRLAKYTFKVESKAAKNN